MLKEAIEKIQQLSRGKIFEVNGEAYSDIELNYIPKIENRPYSIKLNSLDALVDMLKIETTKLSIYKDIFVEVQSPTKVCVFTSYDQDFNRDELFNVFAKLPDIPINRYYDKEEMVVGLRSVFIPNDGTDYIFNLLSKISEDTKIESQDNGIGQTVEAKRGIALKEKIDLKQRIKLAPYRTFLEVEQPESEFILRAAEGAQIMIKNADGGAWEIQAKKNIKKYLTEKLGEIQGIYVIA